MNNNLDIVDIFEIISEHKKSQSKLIFLVNFTGILFTYLSLEPIENFDENWKSELDNGGKMTGGTAKSILYRNRNLTQKYRDEVEATSLLEKPELICNDIENQILRYVKKELLHKELTNKICHDESIPHSDKENMLAESELNMFLARVLIYEVLNGWKVKRRSTKTKKCKIEENTNSSSRKINYSVSVSAKSDIKNQISSPENTKNKEINSPTLVFLPLDEKIKLDNHKREYLVRQTFTAEKPADKVTFNSITNNPNYGDERNFTIAKLTSEGTDKWRDVVEVSENAEYTIRVYVHNNAADNLKLTAENTRVKASIPTTLSNKVTVQGQISASNATPQDIWDQVVFKSDSKKFNIAYVAGSARYYNNVNPSEGFQLSDDIITNTGSLLGYEKMDGKIPGCFQYSGIVTFKVKTQVQKQADFNVSKQVRKVGETEWQKTVKAKPGDKIEYRIGYDNVGEATQNNVIAKDTLPKGITYVSDSTYLKNASNPNGDGMKLASNDLTTKGVNIGNYAPNSNAFVKFTAQIAEAKDLSCGSNKLTNKVNVSTENGAKENTADVEVDVECKENHY